MPLLRNPIKARIINHIEMNSIGKKYIIDTINGGEDHLHCLVKVQPDISVSKMLNEIKGESSYWMNENNITKDYFRWQDGYAVYSVSEQNVQKVRNYINNQDKHHENLSFQDEMKKFRNSNSNR